MYADLLTVGREALRFRYDGYDLAADQGEVLLHYSVHSSAGTESFTETVVLPAGTPADPGAFERVSRLLWLAAGLSYYKAFAPTTVEVPGGLTDLEKTYLAALFRGGLGEFAYDNDLPHALHPVIEAPALPAHGGAGVGREASPTSVLVPVGGGKDSIDTIETLRRAVDAVTLFSVNSYAPIEATAAVAGLPLVHAERRLDPRLFELNAAGALNGHVPVTAVNSAVAVLTALRRGVDAVAFSNERSASYGNLHWAGEHINHQWSKSVEFESLFRDTLAEAGAGVAYFSLLRPLSELAIVRRFAELSAYHHAFTSCNRNFALRGGAPQGRWCRDCPKCRFVFLMLAAFLGPEDVVAILGGDLFADPSQSEGFAELLGLGEQKPFECVGEASECAVAWTLLRTAPGWRDHAFVVDDFGGRAPRPTEHERSAAWDFSDEHFLPSALEKAVRAVH